MGMSVGLFGISPCENSVKVFLKTVDKAKKPPSTYTVTPCPQTPTLPARGTCS